MTATVKVLGIVSIEGSFGLNFANIDNITKEISSIEVL